MKFPLQFNSKSDFIFSLVLEKRPAPSGFTQKVIKQFLAQEKVEFLCYNMGR